MIYGIFLIILHILYAQARFRKHGAAALYCDADHHEVMCHDIYKPVLALTVNGDFTKYSNPCYACSDPRVKFYFELTECPPIMNAVNCETLRAFCGINEMMTVTQFDNACDACDIDGFAYFEGTCPYVRSFIRPSDVEKILRKQAEEYADRFVNYAEY